MKINKNAPCPLCKREKVKGKTTFTADLVFGGGVTWQVPAIVCSQYGAEWIDDSVAANRCGLIQAFCSI